MIRPGGYENKMFSTDFEPLYIDSHIVKTDAFRAAHVLYGGAKLIRVVILRDETTFYEFADVVKTQVRTLLRMLKIHTKTGLWASNFDDLDSDTLLGCPTGRLLKRFAEGASQRH
jgi:hypothetical protein